MCATKIVVLVAALIIGSFACRLTLAWAAVVMAWAIGVVTVIWGPAYNPKIHPYSAGFWVPWLVVLLLACVLAYGAHAFRSWLARRRGT
jgi:hypothetical protein